MNKEMRSLLVKIDNKREKAKAYMDNEEITKASSLFDEIESLQNEYEAKEKEFNAKKENIKGDDKMKNKCTKEFAQGVRAVITKDFSGLSEGVDVNGGYTVPQDIVTKVEELRENEDSLIGEVTVKTVQTDKGQETYKKRGEYNGFASVAEGGKLPKVGDLEFSRLSWDIAKYGGYLPVTNELLDDSDTGIAELMTEWLANESRVTRNNLILTAIKTKTAVDLKDLKGIKKAVTVDLGLFKNTSKLYTNDSGLNYLDTLEDTTGRPLLTPSITEPGKMQLSMGANVIEVKVFSNDTLANDGDKVPFIIGDLKEGVKFFDRKQLTLMTSNNASVGGINAFEEDLTIIRGIEREDCVVRDEKAFVNGYITVTETPVA